MGLEKGLLLFVRGDLAVLDEVLLVAVRIQAIRELGSPLPEVGYGEDRKRAFFSSSVPLAQLPFGDDRYARRG